MPDMDDFYAYKSTSEGSGGFGGSGHSGGTGNSGGSGESSGCLPWVIVGVAILAIIVKLFE